MMQFQPSSVLNVLNTSANADADDDKYAKKPVLQKQNKMLSSSMLSYDEDKYAKKPTADDDKYAKFNSAHKLQKYTPPINIPEPLQKYTATISLLDSIPLPFIGFILFVVAGTSFYIVEGVALNGDKFQRFCSSYLEIFGLLMLRYKIQVRSSANGISGMTVLMYAAVYGVRIGLSAPTSWGFEWKDLDFDASFGVVSFILILDILRCVFVTYRSSYESDQDIMKVQYVIPACWLLAILVRPHFHTWTHMYGYCWSSCMYMDVFALMPQVVMMAKGNGKVQAPIAHFVAATFVSRIGDLVDSLFFETRLRETDFVAYWMVVVMQSVHLLLVADFMYYYVKARSSGKSLVDDFELVAENC